MQRLFVGAALVSVADAGVLVLVAVVINNHKGGDCVDLKDTMDLINKREYFQTKYGVPLHHSTNDVHDNDIELFEDVLYDIFNEIDCRKVIDGGDAWTMIKAFEFFIEYGDPAYERTHYTIHMFDFIEEFVRRENDTDYYSEKENTIATRLATEHREFVKKILGIGEHLIAGAGDDANRVTDCVIRTYDAIFSSNSESMLPILKKRCYDAANIASICKHRNMIIKAREMGVITEVHLTETTRQLSVYNKGVRTNEYYAAIFIATAFAFADCFDPSMAKNAESAAIAMMVNNHDESHSEIAFTQVCYKFITGAHMDNDQRIAFGWLCHDRNIGNRVLKEAMIHRIAPLEYKGDFNVNRSYLRKWFESVNKNRHLQCALLNVTHKSFASLILAYVFSL